VTLPWDPLKKFSSIIGQTCSNISERSNNPATVIEFYLPIKEYIPGLHIPDISARACECIPEVVKTEYTGAISNEDILDLAFVMDPAFIDERTNIVFLNGKCFCMSL